MTKVAIIGAGVAGLSAANALSSSESITAVDIFDKSRGVGGRLATRRFDGFKFDHGATFFTARDKNFKRWLNPLIAKQIIAPWQPKLITLNPNKKPFKRQWFEHHFVGLGGNNTLSKYLAGGHNILCNSGIRQCLKLNEHWFLMDVNGNQYGPYDWLVVAIPPAQLMDLLASSLTSVKLPASVTATKMTCCFAIMLGYEQPLPVTWEWAKVNDSPIASISLEYTKQGRRQYGVVVKSTESWAEEHKDMDINLVEASLLKAFHDLLAGSSSYSNHAFTLPAPIHTVCHRWLYSQKFVTNDDSASNNLPDAYYCDDENQFTCCGDWFLRGDVESAFLSGNAAAQHLYHLLEMHHLTHY